MLAALKGIYLIEYDNHEDSFTWAFPQVDNTVKDLLTQRAGFIEQTPTFSPPLQQPLCHRYKNSWIFTINITAPLRPDDNDKEKYLLPKIVSISIIVDSYNPPAYQALIDTFAKIYTDTPSTTTLLQLYLQANADAKLNKVLQSGQTITWDMASFDPRLALIQPTHKILQQFGLESIIIYISILLKKRIIVSSNDPIEVSTFTRLLVAFGAWHRKDAAIQLIRPLIVSLQNQHEYNDVKSNNTSCIIGVLAQYNNIERYDDLWDVHVDLDNSTISINNNAKSSFLLTKFHKNICEFFLQTLQQAIEQQTTPETTEAQLAISQALIKAAMVKTKEIIDLTNKAKDDTTNLVSMESIKAKQIVPPNLEEFIFNVAVAEGLV